MKPGEAGAGGMRRALPDQQIRLLRAALRTLMRVEWQTAVNSYAAGPVAGGRRNEREIRREWEYHDPAGYAAYQRAERAMKATAP